MGETFYLQSYLTLYFNIKGPSQCGKSHLMEEMLRFKDRIFCEPYAKFIFCSPNFDPENMSPSDEAYQQRLISLANPQEIVFYDHVINLEELTQESNNFSTRLLIFLDDFSESCFSEDVTVKLFIKLSSHKNADIVCAIHHGLASKQAGKHFSMVWNSANVVVLFRTLADRASIGHLNRKFFPYTENHLEKCLSQSTELLGNFANVFIFCNLDNELNKNFGVRANVVSDGPLILFKNPSYYATGMK